jgi:anti-sigma regulatory factor (Ser/Thr protein kinase)
MPAPRTHPESGVTEHTAIRRFAHDPTEIARARRMVRAHMDAWGYDGESQPLELAVSELVTNAIVHGRGLIDVSLKVTDDKVRLEVCDEGGGPSGPTFASGNTGLGGWGLRLVESLAETWGVHNESDGRTRVWMERRL